MNNDKMIQTLREMKRAIYTSPAVTDTVFMPNSDETLCDSIDNILHALGIPDDVIEEENQRLTEACPSILQGE